MARRRSNLNDVGKRGTKPGRPKLDRSSERKMSITEIAIPERSAANMLDLAGEYMSALYGTMCGNYAFIATLLLVVMLSFLLPDLAHKIQATQQVNDLKEVVNKMATDVHQAEVACLTVADEVCCYQCNMRDTTTATNKELKDLSVCTSNIVKVTKSEPVGIPKKIYLKRLFNVHRNASLKEITLMSYVYTDSFDAKDPLIHH